MFPWKPCQYRWGFLILWEFLDARKRWFYDLGGGVFMSKLFNKPIEGRMLVTFQGIPVAGEMTEGGTFDGKKTLKVDHERSFRL